MIHIESNGSRWGSSPPATLDELLEVMAREPLCPSFLGLMDGPDDTPYEGAARIAVRNPDRSRAESSDVPAWIDGDPIHPGYPDARRFFGNFVEVSHAFCVDTDEPEVIERLRAAIAANIASEAFMSVVALRAAHSRKKAVTA